MNEPETPDNEVARLRELLNRAIDNCECKCRSLCDCGRYRRNEEIREELAALAEDVLKLHKPDEEPAPDDLHAWMRIQEDINKEVAGELQSLRDEIQKLKEATPPANQ